MMFYLSYGFNFANIIKLRRISGVDNGGEVEKGLIFDRWSEQDDRMWGQIERIVDLINKNMIVLIFLEIRLNI